MTNVAEKQLDSFGGEFGMRFLELVPIGLEGFVGEDVGSIDEEVDGGFLQLGGFVTVAQLEHLQHVVHAQMRLQNANAVGLQFFQRVLKNGGRR